MIENINDRQKDFPWMMPQDIMIIGAGGIGRRLTEMALKEGNHNVIVIDKNKEK